MSPQSQHRDSFSNGRVRIERLSSVKAGKRYLSAQWFLRKRIAKKSYRFPLGQNKAEALKLAEKIQASLKSNLIPLKEVINEYFPSNIGETTQAHTIAKKEELTIEDILVAHTNRERVLALHPRTAQGYRRSLLRVAYCGQLQLQGKYAPIGRLNDEQISIAEKFPLTILNRQLARAYLQSCIDDIEDLEQLESAKRTANSTLRQAKSVFSQEALELYEDCLLLPIPDLEQFRSKKPLPVEPIRYSLPPKSTIEDLFQYYASLKQPSPAWTACTLALYGGLRRSEVIAARFTWLSDSQGAQISVRTEIDFKPKSGKSRNVSMPPPLYSLLIDKNETATTLFLLGEDPNTRATQIDEINQELRIIFSGVQKPFHELRKLYGCWIAKTKGIREAQRLLGHSSIETTERYYADINMSHEISQLFESALHGIS